jgi:ribosome-binding protein aMBF1 (putative translation factor)
MKTTSAKEYFKKRMKSKSFAKAYEEISPLMDIAFAIAKARDAAGLSQADLAKKLKTAQSVVSRIENGNQNLSVKMLAKIAQILNCDLMLGLKPHKMAA